MRKETVITAVVFFGIGLLAGYALFKATPQQQVPAFQAQSEQPPAGDSGASGQTAGATPQGLPKGHPPIDSAAIIKMLEQQAEENPKDAQARLKLANYYFDQQQFDKAVEWYQKALELDRHNVNAITDLGTSYFNLGHVQEALRQYNRSLEFNPRHEPTLYNLIVANLDGTHDLSAARAYWNRLHGQDPNYPGLDRLKQKLDSLGGRGQATGDRQ